MTEKIAFLVVEGEYSSFQIVCGYSTQVLADEFLELYNAGGHNEGRVREVPFDEPPAVYHRLMIYMQKDGKVEHVFHYHDTKPMEPEKDQFMPWSGRTRNAIDDAVLVCDVNTHEEERAVKTANERRAAIIAAGITWGNDDELKVYRQA